MLLVFWAIRSVKMEFVFNVLETAFASASWVDMMSDVTTYCIYILTLWL
jgi:hypothetical protein